MTRSDDFQRRNLSSVGRIWGTQTLKWGGRCDKKRWFSKEKFEFGWPDLWSTNLKMNWTIWQKVTIFNPGFSGWGRCRGNRPFSKGYTTFTWYVSSTQAGLDGVSLGFLHLCWAPRENVCERATSQRRPNEFDLALLPYLSRNWSYQKCIITEFEFSHLCDLNENDNL